MLTKSRLAILLSKIKDFEKPKPGLEQYSTDSETAARIVWNAFMQGDIKDKVVADLGCGSGILGLGALLLGAEWVHFLDINERVLALAKSNIRLFKEFQVDGRAHFIQADIKEFNRNVDTVLQNPPFGVQKEHADREFLKIAMENAKVIYSIHKIESEGFVQGLCDEQGFTVTHLWRYSLPLKMTMAHHTHRIRRVNVGCWRIIKKKTI